MPLELTHAAQKEWKSYEKWNYVYNESATVEGQRTTQEAQNVSELTAESIQMNHGPTLCEVYGKGAALAKSLLRAKYITEEPKNILVCGSAICDLPNALCETFRSLENVYWMNFGFVCSKRLHLKVSLVEAAAIPDVDFDICIDNGLLDIQCFLNHLGSVADRIQTLISAAKHQLIIVTVAHDAILKDLIKIFQKSEQYKLQLLRNLPNNPRNTNYIPFPMIFTIGKRSKEPCEFDDAQGSANVEKSGNDQIINEDKTQSRSLPVGYVLVRQPVSVDGKWNFREAHMHVLRLPRVVKEWRMESFINRIVPNHLPGILRHFDIVDEEGKISYSISMYDRRLHKISVKTVRQLKPCVAVMVPLADDHHWLYRTITGHQRLAEKAGTKRVLCVFLPSFASFKPEDVKNPAQIVEQIRKDIGTHLIQLNSDPKKPVLLMTQQEKFEDERKRVADRISPVQGEILVYDVIVDKHDEEFKEDPETDTEYHQVEPSEFIRRTLIIENNPRVAQTEVWYTLAPESTTPSFVFTHICHSYQIPILQIVLTIAIQNKSAPVGALLGTGGGLLFSLLNTVFAGNVQLECVDIDPTIVDLAVEYFGYENKDKTIVMDALEYVRDKSKSENKMDYLVVDINGTLGVTSTGLEDVTGPHKDFLQPDFLFNAASCVSEMGCVILNSVCQTPEARKALGTHLKSHFPKVMSAVYSDELNVIFVCYGEGSTYLNSSLNSIRRKFLENAKHYPPLAEVVEKTPLYLGAKSKNVLNIVQHSS